MKSFSDLKKSCRRDVSDFPKMKVALLGDTATQFLAVALKGAGVDRGYNIQLFEAEYNQVERQILDHSSEFYGFKADYSIVFQSSHKLLESFSLSNDGERESFCANRLAFVKELCSSVSGKIIYCNYPEIGDGVFGSFQNKVTNSFIYQLRKLNLGLMELSKEFPNLFVCDLSEISAKYGRNSFFDRSVYVNTEMVLSLVALPVVASRMIDIICAIEGKFKKCLIVDLDNTLWGGIVGDDGWENIQVGHGLGIGKVYSELQQWIKKLRERGIIICVCSKNDEIKAKEPFEKNPEMVLRLDDFAVFMANWENKVVNLKTIQKILNIGFDSMVFLDDNPFERNMVRENIPGITVPELPEHAEDYLEYLYELNLFETASFSATDKDRTRQYQQEAQRTSLNMSFTNEDDFLASLNMISTVEGFTPYNTPRVAQLSQRSNQFNLRTVRYTETDIKNLADDGRNVCLSFTLEDKFGDNGLIGVIIMRPLDEKTLFIDTWFMSCRVLKRGMEHFMLNTVVTEAKNAGYCSIIGEYRPTAKNAMVENFYPGLGFTKIKEVDGFMYKLSVESYTPKECHIIRKKK